MGTIEKRRGQAVSSAMLQKRILEDRNRFLQLIFYVIFFAG